MPTALLEKTLKRIRQAGIDFYQCHDFINQNKVALLSSKDIACGLVRAIIGNDQDRDAISGFLVVLLDEVRMSLENDYGYGAEFAEWIEEAIKAEQATGALSSEELMHLAAIFHRAGLDVPQYLVLDPSRIPVPEEAEGIDPSAMLTDMVRKVEAEGGTPFDAFLGLDEMMSAIPEEPQTLIAHCVAISDAPFLERCALYMLLSKSPVVCSAVIVGFNQKAIAGTLSPNTVNLLPVIRGWLQQGKTQSSLDELIKHVRRKQLATTDSLQSPTKIINITATIADGVGAQQFAILLEQGMRLTMAMVMTKIGYGIKDAFLVPIQSKLDAEDLQDHLYATGDAGDITIETLGLLLEAALADGLENKSLPVPGFLDIIEVCSFLSLRPQQTNLEKLLDHVDSEHQIREASKQKLGRWVNDERGSLLLVPATMSWFEDCQEIRDAVESSRTARTVETKVWKYLETRREFWSRRFLQTALLYKDSERLAEWRLLASSAYGLMNGRELKKIPLMEEIASSSVNATAFRNQYI